MKGLNVNTDNLASINFEKHINYPNMGTFSIFVELTIIVESNS